MHYPPSTYSLTYSYFLEKCSTIGGPNPFKPCIFPFIWNEQTFNGIEKLKLNFWNNCYIVHILGCPLDHKDNSKRWCSTKVDSSGNHIENQNEYGYCADNCPISCSDDCPTSDENELTSSSTIEVIDVTQSISIEDEKITTPSSIDTTDGIDSNSIESLESCNTISGPNPGKRCIFPFIWNNKIFHGIN